MTQLLRHSGQCLRGVAAAALVCRHINKRLILVSLRTTLSATAFEFGTIPKAELMEEIEQTGSLAVL